MTWAEEVGIGDMGLAPSQFWALTVREFYLKHEAFIRAEDRMRALVMEHALMVGNFGGDAKATRQLHRSIAALRRYPMKPWEMREEPEE